MRLSLKTALSLLLILVMLGSSVSVFAENEDLFVENAEPVYNEVGTLPLTDGGEGNDGTDGMQSVSKESSGGMPEPTALPDMPDDASDTAPADTPPRDSGVAPEATDDEGEKLAVKTLEEDESGDAAGLENNAAETTLEGESRDDGAALENTIDETPEEGIGNDDTGMEIMAPDEELSDETGAEAEDGEVAAVINGWKNGLCYSSEFGWQLYIDNQLADYYTGLYFDSELGWWLVDGGTIAFDYTGLWCDQNIGWWLVSGGTIAFDYNGLWYDQNIGWWLVSGGTIAFDYNGLWYDQNIGWWLINGGTIAFDYNGLCYDQSVGWWLVRGGTIAFDYTGLWCDQSIGWWLVRGGTIAFDYNGLWYDQSIGWWLVRGGTIAFDYKGLWCDQSVGWWLVDGGTIAFDYTGLWCDPVYSWWLIGGGQIAFDYNGLWYDQSIGWWLVRGGTIAFDYNGFYDDVSVGRWLIDGGRIAFDYSGLLNDEKLGWVLVGGGSISYSYTGLWNDEKYGWHLIRNGLIDHDYTGLYRDQELGVWFIKEGRLDSDYFGLWNDEILGNGWCVITNGCINDQYNGVAGSDSLGSWFFNQGKIDYSYSGLFNDSNYGWVVIEQGKAILDYTGVKTNEYGSFYFEDGVRKDGYSGFAMDTDNGYWVSMRNGDIDTTYAGLIEVGDKNQYYSNGKPDSVFTGIARNTNGTWYVKNGVIDTSYSGQYVEGGITYSVTNGKAKAISAENPMLGVFFNSRGDTSDTLYLSFDGFDFYSLGPAYENAFKQDDSVIGETENNVATISPSLNPSSPFSDWVVNTLHDPCIFYKDGVFWMLGGMAEGEEFTPMLGYSTDLVNWSFPSAGKDYIEQGLKPTLTPLDANGQRTNASGFDAVAVDAFVDDDGSVWMTVALGFYGDSFSNRLSQYIVKATGLTAPADSSALTTEKGRVDNSDFNVTYGALNPINLPEYKREESQVGNRNVFDYDYDASLFKHNGKYYLVVQHSGEEVQLYSIDDLNNASDPNAWTLVNAKMTEGSEGPCVTFNNGKYYLYTDRYALWQHNDGWDNTYGIFGFTANSLDQPFAEHARINTIDNTGKKIPARHGTIITLNDANAKNTALNLYNAIYG